jgi:hypothetical protein
LKKISAVKAMFENRFWKNSTTCSIPGEIYHTIKKLSMKRKPGVREKNNRIFESGLGSD